MLMTIAAVLCIAGSFWSRINLSPQDIRTFYEQPFASSGLEFNYLSNIIIPKLFIIVATYVCFCWMHFIILPALWAYGRYTKSRYIFPVFQIVALIIAWGSACAFFIFYNEQYIYGPMGDEGPRIVWIQGMTISFITVLIYGIYSTIRELILRYLASDHKRKAFRIGMSNRVSGFMVGYLVIVLFFFLFIDKHDPGFYLFYFTVIPPVLLLCLVNLYWIFPANGEGRLFRWPFIWLQMRVSFLITLPFAMGLAHNPHVLIAVLFFLWLVLLLVVTPISWLIYRNQKDRIQQVRGLEKQLGESNASLQFLRSQINPHFLFNALNTLYGTALQENAARAAEGIQKLGDMMRFMLHENNQDKIPMQKEIEYLQNYIALQQLRTQSSPSIQIRADIDNSHCHHSIAPMLLVPFVENAFKHGISLQENSWIHIKLYCDEKNILFEVRNSVHSRQEKDPEKDRSGIGMKNVLNRLRLVYPRQHQFFVNGDEKEFYVQLVIEVGS